jgi:hypothetical protein
MMFKPAGTVTGLYREDYGYNATAAAFTPYRDVWRDMGSASSISSNTEDGYAIRIVGKKKDKN